MLRQRMIMAVLSLFFTLASLHASTTDELAHDGEVAFYHQNYIEARKALQPASEQGSLQSLYYLGIMSLQGLGTPANYKEAIRIFKEAAQKDHPESQVALGVLMIEGIGIPQDFIEASVLFTKAAKSGNPDAQLILGWIFKNGIGVKPNNTIAYALWNYVAAQGNDWARYNRDAMFYELDETELYRGQELSADLPKLWKAIALEHKKISKIVRKKRQ